MYHIPNSAAFIAATFAAFMSFSSLPSWICLELEESLPSDVVVNLETEQGVKVNWD